MQESRPARPVMLLLAIAFLVEAWVWDSFVALGRWLVALIPWDALKARIKAVIAVVPAPLALVIFVVPLAVVEPLKVVSVWLMATGHFALGVVGFILLQFLGVGLVAVVFDLTREKLLEMAWFAWTFAKVTAFHAFADQIIAPYKEAALRELRTLRQCARDYRARLAAVKDG
ncbi:MAG: hypothetical protein ABR878_18300 [Roseiarcus sp.]